MQFYHIYISDLGLDDGELLIMMSNDSADIAIADYAHG
ncbi:hypothetical protein GM3709_554 [Geminocystis sp. NIES-3709]|nr:hypothetical protein GM3709_554 [Geminocystis sp. NIES-3709]